MSRRAFLSFLIAASLTLPWLPAAAQVDPPSDPSYGFEGSGWGHGVGMSQYGARALAETGRTAADILATYYDGVTLDSVQNLLAETHWLRADPAPLWIGLAQNVSVLRFTVEGGPVGLCKANDGEGECPTQFANPGETWELRALSAGACQYFRDGLPVGNQGTCRAALEWDDQPATRVTFTDTGRTYARGSIRIRPNGPDVFHVVLQIGVEDYVKGIGEVPSNWPTEALRAQAIAARTYGVRQALRWGSEPELSASRRAQCWCQLFSTVVDQNYVGWSKESSQDGHRWAGAVDATPGMVETHPEASQANVIVAYYHSSSGGHTDSNVDGFGHTTPIPYLPGTSDPWSIDPIAQNPFAAWRKDVTASTIAAKVGLDTVTGLTVTGRHTSGSVAQVAISGTLAGIPTTVTKTGRALKSLLGLRSIFFTVAAPTGAVVPDTSRQLCQEPAPDAGFNDVDSESVHKEDIDCIAFYQITSGIGGGAYGPTRPVTRWQMALFLVREASRLGIEIPDGADQGFGDLDGLLDEAILAINQLRQMEITKGTSDAVFDPQAPVTRWQMALFLTRVHAFTGFELPGVSGSRFTDLQGLSKEATTAIEQLASLGITTGTTATEFSPDRTVTREQMASFLARLLRADT